MKKTKLLFGRLACLLLTPAMISAYIPTLSVTAAAEDNLTPNEESDKNQETCKLKFYRSGNYDYNSTVFTSSVEYNGSPLELNGTGVDAYYLVPKGERFNLTVLPLDDYYFEDIYFFSGDDYDSWLALDVSPNGTYYLYADEDTTVYLTIGRTTTPQYVDLDLSSELQKSLADGEINYVTVEFSNGMTKTFDSTSSDYSVQVLNDEKVKIRIDAAEGCSIAKINDIDAAYDSKSETYSADVTVTYNTTVSAAVYSADELATLKLSLLNISNPGDKATVTPDPVNAERGEYKAGTECEIVATITDDKFIGVSEFNGAHIDAYSLDSDGCHYKVKLDEGENEFYIYYADLSILRIPEPANGSITFSGRLDGGRSFKTQSDGTQVYYIGTWDEITLTLTPDEGYQLSSAKMNGNAVKTTNNTYTFNIEQCVDWSFTAEFTKKNSGGSTGGSTGNRPRPSRNDNAEITEDNPLLNGVEKSWTDIASDLGKNTANSEVQINLNGVTTVPEDVIRVIAERKLRAEFVINSVSSWIVNGAELNTVSSADFSIFPGNADRSALRGVPAANIKVAGVNIPADLRLNIRMEYVGQFANVYKLIDGKLVFQGCAKVGEDGTVNISGVNTAGEYVIMVCQYSDVPGDADNNGTLNVLDAAALLKDIADISASENSLMCDFNGDGTVNVSDVSAILKRIVGIA